MYAVRKVWRQLNREGVVAARCTVARLMRELGLRGVVRGRRVNTTTPVATLPCPADRVNRVFHAPRPNALWLADLTYVATWVGFVSSRSSSTPLPGASWAGGCRNRGPWRGREPVEFATLDWVDWFNHRRILEPIGNRPPAEAEAAYYHQLEHTALAA